MILPSRETLSDRVGDERGFGFIVVLAALLIVGLLYFTYFGMNTVKHDQAVGIKAIDTSKAFSCKMQRGQIERELNTWAATHDGQVPTDLDDLARSGIRIPKCPEGGEYSLEEKHVHCSVHD